MLKILQDKKLMKNSDICEKRNKNYKQTNIFYK